MFCEFRPCQVDLVMVAKQWPRHLQHFIWAIDIEIDLASEGPPVKLIVLSQHLAKLVAKCGGEAPPDTIAAVLGLHACRNVPTESGNTVETSLLMVVVRERLTKVKAFPFRDACPSISDLRSNMVKIGPIWSNMDGYWSQKWSTKVKKHIFPEMSQN